MARKTVRILRICKFTANHINFMKTLTIKVPDKKYPFFIELIKNLNLDLVKEAKTDDEPTKEQILTGIREAVDEVNAIKAGKKKAVLLKDFLNEL
jgi:hypothetical protein